MENKYVVINICISIYLFDLASSQDRLYLEDPKSILQLNHRRNLIDDDAEYAYIGLSYEKGSLWPKPQSEKRSETNFYTFNPVTFKFRSSTKNAILQNAFSRYEELTFPQKNRYPDNSLTRIDEIEVIIEDLEQPLNTESNESYTLNIGPPAAVLKANSVWGALRGLETFSQAVYLNDSSYRAAGNIIKDYPRFSFRGFLIDTSRHYLPVPMIYQFLDAMTYSKFNVLHWHIVDDNSFPYVSNRFPQLHTNGAFDPKTHVYTPRDVKDIIEFAKLRGIRVMPEFDTPGHTHSWKGIPNLLTDCKKSTEQSEYMLKDMKGPINPIREGTYEFLEEFFKEVADVFPDEYFHLGGDEVDFDCWLSNDGISKWLANRTGANGTTLHTHYLTRLIEIVENLKKKYVVWQEVFDDGVKLKNNTIVNVWKPSWKEELNRITKAGHIVILSSCWYLNYIKYGLDWPKFYKCDPHDFIGSDEQLKLVIGGSAAMWGEYVDATNIIPRSFGRSFAVAERLWSSKDTDDVKSALPRIWEHQCRYINRGIPAEPVTRGLFCRNEWNSSH